MWRWRRPFWSSPAPSEEVVEVLVAVDMAPSYPAHQRPNPDLATR
jgi:hypothetical protein